MTEAMQWTGWTEQFASYERAEEIVAWVNTNGGQAHLSVDPQGELPTRIQVRQRDDEVTYCSPGQWVVKGDVFTICEHGYSPATCRNYRQVHEFTVESR